MGDELKDLAAALAAAQGKIENAKKDTANPFFKSKYADLACVWDAIREPLSSEGLSVIQTPCDVKEGHVGLTTTLLHSSGQLYSTVFSMPVKDATNPQAVGSALTYARRYALMGLVGIAPEDDDGNSATKVSSSPARAPAAVPSYQPLNGFEGLSETAQRAEYSKVRNSSMAEPLKTSTLTAMSTIIKGKSKNNG